MLITNNVIPPMTDSLGAYWTQPERERILLDETHCLMDKESFGLLSDYSRSTPSGVYDGKMWKRQFALDQWELVWFAESEIKDTFDIDSRIILIL